jgi:N-acylglucosamine 2-epimerase
MNWKSHLRRYEKELLDNLVPFWTRNCLDREKGGYFTFLDRDGSVYDTEKFMWMQWRIVYMFAELYLSPYRKDGWLEISLHGWEFLTAHGKDPDGHYYFSLNREGVPAVTAYNIYSECFAAMAAAALFKATGQEKFRSEARLAMSKYLARMDAPKGRWEKSLEGRKPYYSLGHYMMLANLSFIMKNYLADGGYEKEVGTSLSLVLEKFYDPSIGVLFENVGKDPAAGRIDLASSTGRHLNPGHGLEALWFILQVAEEKNDRAVIDKAADIVLSTLEFSWDRRFGGIYYFMDALGRPHGELQWDMKLWWVHCEAIVAVLYAYRLTGRREFLAWYKRLDSWTWRHFPDRKYGEWFGYLNRRGEPTHMLKGGKWKTFFHIPRFLLVSAGLMKKIIAADG